MQALEEYKEAIDGLCSHHYVRSLSAFGSVLNKSFNEESEIDLVLNFEGDSLLEYFNNYMEFNEQLEELLGCEVDLIEEKAVQEPYFQKNS
tara:strand:- start:780 stop:1052 length:273 start_codon:yes stop_codon:yes gene_type:complete